MKTRWLAISITVVIALAGSAALTSVTTPLYQSSVRLFVSAGSGGSARDMYQGNLFSEQRVSSYTKLLMGEALAQRTVEKLNLGMTAEQLQHSVTAHSPPNTVLIDVSVLNRSPSEARAIAEVLADEFTALVARLESPPNGPSAGARVIVYQPASLPADPVIPKWARNLTAGLVVGVIAGFGVGLLRDRLDRTVKTAQVVEELASVSTIGAIPLDGRLRRDAPIAFNKDKSIAAEAFRRLRTNLQFLKVDDPPRAIVVTGPLSYEGKTTVATNLALALAEGGDRVVLVAGDMRRPKFNSYLSRTTGLSTVLSGRASLADVLVKTRFPRLTVLPSGATPPNASELLGSFAAESLLGELRGLYDYVVIDSPSLLAVSDAALMAARADGAIVVIRVGATKRDHVTAAAACLERVGAQLLGVVLTAAPANESPSHASEEGGGRAEPLHASSAPTRATNRWSARFDRLDPAGANKHVPAAPRATRDQ